MTLRLMTLALLLSAGAWAQNQPAELLLSKARSLEARGRLDLASQTWQQLLMIQPDQQDALAGMARASRQSGKESDARLYLDRLRKLNPQHAALNMTAAGPKPEKNTPLLDEAARYAKQGQFDKAVAAYKQAFGETPPPGRWSVAYYETLAGTAGGWEKATAGLETLSERHPDPEYKLALGKLYIYRPATRQKGLTLLQSVASDPALGAQTQQAWRQALIWENGNVRSDASLRVYVGKYPDAELEKLVRKQAPVVAAIDPMVGIEVQNAYRSLKKDDLADAEARFRAALKVNPKDAGAQTGLGFVQMKQEDFASALKSFEAAATHADSRLLRDAIKEARFWMLMQEGSKAAKSSRGADAEALYSKALTERPSSPEAMEGYAGALMLRGDVAAASPVLERMVKADPANSEAWRSLVRAKHQKSGATAALELIASIPKAVVTKLATDLEYTAALAGIYREAGQSAEARRTFQHATTLLKAKRVAVPAYVELQLASLHLEFGEPAEAALRYKAIFQVQPDNLNAWEGYLLAMHRAKNPEMALRQLEQLPASVHAAAQLRPTFLRAVASLQVAAHNLPSAENLLERVTELESADGKQPALYTQLQLAQLWLDQGKGAKASQLFAELVTKHPENLDAWKGWIISLNRQFRYEEAAGAVRSASAEMRGRLLDDPDYVTVVASVYKELGAPEDAIGMLRQVLSQYTTETRPTPPPLVTQFAWLLLGNPGNERELFTLLRDSRLRSDFPPDQRKALNDVWIAWITQTADAANVKGDAAHAAAVLEAGVRMFPNDARLQRSLAATLLNAGESAKALTLFKATSMGGATAGDYLAAIGTAITERDKAATLWLAEALKKFPKDADLLNLAGKQAALKGDFKRAEVYWKSALQTTTANPADDFGTLMLGKTEDRTSLPLPTRSVAGPGYRLPWEAATTPKSVNNTDSLLREFLAPVLNASTTTPVVPFAPPPKAARESLEQLLAISKPQARPLPQTSSLPREESSQINDQLRAMQSRNSPYSGLGGMFQTRGGAAGFDRFIVQESQLESSTMLSNKVRVGLIAKSIFTDSGTPDGENLLRFGALPAGDTFASQSVNGLAAEGQISTENFGLRFGSTPRGFLVPNLIGGLRFRPGGGPIAITLERDSVKDTMLSYSGARDPLSRKLWGGVMSDSGNVSGNWGDDRSGAYFGVGYQRITGMSVQKNSRADANVGSYWRLVNTSAGALNAGVNLFAMRYEKNLRYFTLGHGGYFSPQRFVLFNVPVTWTGKWNRLEYTVGTSIGSQSFNEDASPFFPLDTSLQGKAGPVYPKFASSGLNYNLDGRFSYQVGENWFMGGFMNVNNARFYSLQSTALYIKYAFRPKPLMSDFTLPSVPDWKGRQPFGKP